MFLERLMFLKRRRRTLLSPCCFAVIGHSIDSGIFHRSAATGHNKNRFVPCSWVTSVMGSYSS